MLDRQTASPEMETAAVGRPTGSLRFVGRLVITVQALFALGFFLAQCLSSNRAPWLSITNGILGTGFALLSVWMAVYLAKACVVADAVGLRWRGAGEWHKAAWADVVSYSEHWPLNSTAQSNTVVKVKTLYETLTISTENWTSTAGLRESISRYATQAPQSGWLVTGSPATYFPLSCRYDTAINRSILRWMDDLHQCGLAAVAVYFVVQWFTTHTLPGWGWLVTPTGLFVIAKQALPLLWRPLYRATEPRLGDTVSADQNGLRFVTSGSDTQIAWADITSLSVAGFRTVVITEEGRYDFLDSLTDAKQLRAVILRFAVNAGRTSWRCKDFRSDP